MNEHYQRLVEKFKKSKKKIKKRFDMSWEMLAKMKSELKFFDEYLWERTRRCGGIIPFDMPCAANPEPVLRDLEKIYERRKKLVEKWERRMKAIDNRMI